MLAIHLRKSSRVTGILTTFSFSGSGKVAAVRARGFSKLKVHVNETPASVWRKTKRLRIEADFLPKRPVDPGTPYDTSSRAVTRPCYPSRGHTVIPLTRARAAFKAQSPREQNPCPRSAKDQTTETKSLPNRPG